MISSLPLNNFYPVISFGRVRKRKKATNYCIRSAQTVASARGLILSISHAPIKFHIQRGLA